MNHVTEFIDIAIKAINWSHIHNDPAVRDFHVTQALAALDQARHFSESA